MAATTYVISAPPPIRAFMVSAIAALAGALLVVGGASWGWHVIVTWLGGLLILLGLGLMVLAFLSMRKLTVRLMLDEVGYRVEGGGTVHSATWREVTKVTQSADGVQVTIHQGDEKRTRLLFRRASLAQLDLVLSDMHRRLQASRGL